ncbi:MAG TPA: GNAT family N-acetyltransferase [Candidatus Baltobacteraceae bacterium]
MHIELFGVDDEPRMKRALAIRIAVFVDEQHVPLNEEIDGHDRDDTLAVHALATFENRDAGTGRFYVRTDAQTVQIGRMAVVREVRGHGIGRALLNALMIAAKTRGFTQASLSAQTHARAFYEASGFIASGDIFYDAGIPHQEMTHPL